MPLSFGHNFGKVKIQLWYKLSTTTRMNCKKQIHLYIQLVVLAQLYESSHLSCREDGDLSGVLGSDKIKSPYYGEKK